MHRPPSRRSSAPRGSAGELAARCRHFGECGGCDWLDLAYPAQLERKQKLVAGTFATYAALSRAVIEPVVPAPGGHHYRNRLLYPVAKRNGRIIAGFFKKKSHALVEVVECAIQISEITTIARGVIDIINELDVPVAPVPGVESEPQASPAGAGIRAIAVRMGHHTREILIGIVTNGGVFPAGASIAARCMELARILPRRAGRAARIVGVVRNINDKETNVVLGDRSLALAGRDYYTEEIDECKFHISLTSFFQPNAVAARAVVREILLFAGGGGIIDAFAGVGFPGIPLSRDARKVVAIEESPSAVRDALTNIKINKAGHMQFLRGRVEDVLPTIPLSRGDVLVLDPPRSGLDPRVVAAVKKSNIEKIAYLSCAHTTLARDLALLAPDFETRRVIPFDFLPQTEHIESLAFAIR